MKRLRRLFAALLILSGLSIVYGCATTTTSPLPTPATVDLDRFMGTWYVVGYTSLGVDKDAHNAIEHYFLAESGKIETTYQFRQGGFDGEVKTLTPVGEVANEETNAEWRMQFVWPFKADYVILDLSADYSRTIIAHPNRKYAWIMNRDPEVSSSDYESMVKKLEEEGFDPKVIQKVPHDWSGESERLSRIREAGSEGRLVVE